eukprot:2402239-Rhodomonas_salina.1
MPAASSPAVELSASPVTAHVPVNTDTVKLAKATPEAACSGDAGPSSSSASHAPGTNGVGPKEAERKVPATAKPPSELKAGSGAGQ